MNLFRHFAGEIVAALRAMQADGDLPQGLDFAAVTAEPPRDPKHGDIATNAAMVLAKAAGRKPRDIAVALALRLQGRGGIVQTEVAGPGFINLRLDEAFWHERLREILAAGAAYGDSAIGGGTNVNVEYVSANPTGPLTVAHGRGAVFGDVLANLLGKAGWAVTKEYYINDAGAQVDTLARSTYLRYREALGHPISDIPEGLYPGEYLKEVAAALVARDGSKWLDHPEAEWLPSVRAFAVEQIMAGIREDLAALGVEMDVFTSERALVESSAVDAAFRTLSEQGLVYQGRLEPPKGEVPDDWEDREQTLFRATQFGDDVDRPLKKSDGSWTYFANDIANHHDKFRRGFADMIDVWGADHGGYVKRVQAAVKAITGGKGTLDIKLCQLVHLMKGGQLVRMSKRAGNFVTLRDLIEDLDALTEKGRGRDVVRFIMLTRSNEKDFDFDIAKATEQSRDNHVWYVQYAHARTCSVFRQAAEAGVDIPDAAGLAAARLDRLVDAGEMALIRLLAQWPRQVEAAATAHEPHRLAFYLYELAGQFHAHWNRGKEDAGLRFIVEADRDLTLARLALVKSVQSVVSSGLQVFGVPPAEEMR
jgi:arginyl-tRNA synthetase